jgi:hypothetical protein
MARKYSRMRSLGTGTQLRLYGNRGHGRNDSFKRAGGQIRSESGRFTSEGVGETYWYPSCQHFSKKQAGDIQTRQPSQYTPSKRHLPAAKREREIWEIWLFWWTTCGKATRANPFRRSASLGPWRDARAIVLVKPNTESTIFYRSHRFVFSKEIAVASNGTARVQPFHESHAVTLKRIDKRCDFLPWRRGIHCLDLQTSQLFAGKSPLYPRTGSLFIHSSDASATVP